MIFGVAQEGYVETLQRHAKEHAVPMHDISTPLSRCNVLIQAMGPVHTIKHERGNPVTLATMRGATGVRGWLPLEKITIKHIPAEEDIERVLLYIGSKNSFRSEKKNCSLH